MFWNKNWEGMYEEIQKVIKYLAILFAVLIVGSIFSALVSTVAYFTNSSIGFNSIKLNTEMKVISGDESDIKEIEIDLKASHLEFETGNEFRVETNNKNIKYEYEDSKVIIKETSYDYYRNSSLVITVPKTKISRFKINVGSGKTTIKDLEVDDMEFSLGAGKVYIEGLKVNEKFIVESGAGKLNIKDAEINNIELEHGAGETNITGILNGKSRINHGIGELNIKLQESKDLYKIKVSKGLGDIRLNGKKVEEGSFGDGDKTLDINGGLGEINITTEE